MEKSDFCQYIGLCKEIDGLEKERERLMAIIQAPQKIDGQPRGKGKKSDKVGSVAVKLAAIAVLINKKLDELIDLRGRIEAVLDKLPADDRHLMRLRYIDGLTWPQVTEKIYGIRGDFIDREESYRRTITNHHIRILAKVKEIA